MSSINSSHPKKKKRNHHRNQQHNHGSPRSQREQSGVTVFMTASSRSTAQTEMHSRSSSQIYPTTGPSDDNDDNNDYQPNNNDNLSYQQWLVNISPHILFVFFLYSFDYYFYHRFQPSVSTLHRIFVKIDDNILCKINFSFF